MSTDTKELLACKINENIENLQTFLQFVQTSLKDDDPEGVELRWIIVQDITRTIDKLIKTYIEEERNEVQT